VVRFADKQDKPVPCHIYHNQALRAAVYRSGCASSVNRLLSSSGRLFLGHTLLSPSCAPLQPARLPSEPIRRRTAVVQAGCLWRHTFRRCKYPPAFHPISPPASSVLPSAQSSSSPPSKRPETKGWRFAPLLLLFSSPPAGLYCNTSCVFCLPSPYPPPSTTGYSWPELLSLSFH
jgi:hypothetical protein